MEYNIKMGIISDLHCHPSNVSYGSETFLKSDLLRNNKGNHPVEALLELIDSQTICTDLVICPGDFSNKADVQGFISGWNFVLEIAKKLNSKEIIATVGNHDVPSRDPKVTDIFETAKGIGNNFPMKDKDLVKDFWNDGFCLFEQDDFQILVINTVKFHNNESEINRGKISKEQLDNIEEKLTKSATEKIKIALCHHHPIQHERLGLGSHDLMILGNELVDLLNKKKFDLLIHGHKHDAWLRYSSGSNSLPVFSSGSFSATGHILFNDRKNTFHTIQINKKEGERAKGIIETYEFYIGSGWQKSLGQQSLPFSIGFGLDNKIDIILNEIILFLDKKPHVEWETVILAINDILYLTQDEQLELEANLLRKNIKVVPSYPSCPQYLIKL